MKHFTNLNISRLLLIIFIIIVAQFSLPKQTQAQSAVNPVNFCGTEVVNASGGYSCKVGGTAQTEPPLDMGAVHCADSEYDCCLSTYRALTGYDCPTTVAPPKIDPSVPAPTCGEIKNGACYIGSSVQSHDTFATCPSTANKCCYTLEQCGSAPVPKVCGKVDGISCKSPNGSVLGILNSNFFSCPANNDICCESSASCPATSEACGVSTGNSCFIDGSYYRYSAGCGTNDTQCCISQLFCPNIATCGKTYNSKTNVCSCAGAYINNPNAEGISCCGWEYDGTCNPTKANSSLSCGETKIYKSISGIDMPSCDCSGGKLTNVKKGDSFEVCCGWLDSNNTCRSKPRCGEVGTINKEGNEGGCNSGYVCYEKWVSTYNKLPAACYMQDTTECSAGHICLDGCSYVDQCIGGKRCVVVTAGGSSTIYVNDKETCGECEYVGQCIDNISCIVGGPGLVRGGGSCGVPPPAPGDGGDGGDTPKDGGPTLDIFNGPTSADFKLLNPLAMFNSRYTSDFSSPAGIINRLLLFAFPLAGLILFVMIVWGGFEVLTGAANSKGVQAGKQRITAALLGFGLLFVSFWIIQIVEYIFNLAIL